MKTQPCEICQTAEPASVLFPPSPFAPWRKQPGCVEWAQDVYVCKECGSLWRFQFHPKDMYTESAALIPRAAEPLVRAGTPWTAAWETRKVSNELVPQYIHLYFERTALRWREVVGVAVVDAVTEGRSVNAFAALRGLFGNWPSLRAGGVKSTEIETLWARLERLRPEPADAVADCWQSFESQVSETIRLLQAEEDAVRRSAAERMERAKEPKIIAPYSPFYTERIPGPELQVQTEADHPDAREVLGGVLYKLGRSPFAYVLPALGTALVMDAFAPASQAGELAGVTFFPMCLMAYAAQASLVSGRWDQPFWKLYIDRFGQIFQLWGVLILALLFTFGIGFALLAVGPEELGYRRELNYLAVALILVPSARFWPVVVTTFVYRGYLYYESVDPGADVNSVWIGPNLGAAWRISGQQGFLLKITLPLFAAAGFMIAFLYWAEFAWWARWFSYFVALPLMVQFADEAVERWRVLTGKSGVDW